MMRPLVLTLWAYIEIALAFLALGLAVKAFKDAWKACE